MNIYFDTFCLFYTMQPIDTYLMLACIACCFPSAPALSELQAPSIVSLQPDSMQRGSGGW